jgi:hypothetical protein
MIQYPFWPYPMDPDHPRNKREAKFWILHAIKPQVYRYFDRCAKILIAEGVTHYGAKAIFEDARWHTGLSMKELEDYKISNDLPAYYARFWLQNNDPKYWELFQCNKCEGEYPQFPPREPPTFDDEGQGLLPF